MRNTLMAAVVVLVGLGGTARADLAPPEGYVESCTIENQQRDGEECVVCGAWHGEPDACVAQYPAAEGWVERCQTRGASAWSEVWCHPKAAGPTPAAPEAGTTDPVPAPAAEAGTPTAPPDAAASRPPADAAPATPPQPSRGCAAAAPTGGPLFALLAIGALALFIARRRG